MSREGLIELAEKLTLIGDYIEESKRVPDWLGERVAAALLYTGVACVLLLLAAGDLTGVLEELFYPRDPRPTEPGAPE